MSDAMPISTVCDIRDRCLCLATQRAARRLARHFDRAFAGLGLTNGQFSLMVALSGDWRPNHSELAGFLAMDQTTLTAALKSLQRRGLIVIAQDDKDRRIRRPALTPEGRALVAQAVPIWQAEHARIDATLPDPGALPALLAQLG
jgi:DNA-binding MarR family transcriptional regulator